MTTPSTTAPLLTDAEAEIIVRWAELHSDKVRAVLLYGSRFTGHRTSKKDAPLIPDVDLALSIAGEDRTTIAEDHHGWLNTWYHELTPLLGLPVHLCAADADLNAGVVRVLRKDGYRVLWCDSERWTPNLLGEG